MRLGSEVFGSWILLISILGYYGLLSVGLDSSLVRYLSRYLGEGRKREAIQLIGAAHWIFASLALAIFAAGLILGCGFLFSDWIFSSVFILPSHLRSEFSVLLVVLGAGTACSLLGGVPLGVLRSLGRWDLVGRVRVGVVLGRALAVLLLMRDSMLTLGSIFAAFQLIETLFLRRAAHGILPESRFWASSRRELLVSPRVVDYGALTVVNQLVDLVRFRTDPLVIGHFLPLSLLSYYNFGFRLVDYLRQVVGNLAWPFFPLFSSFDARRDKVKIRRTFLLGSRLASLPVILVAGNLFGVGLPLLEVWIGDEIGVENVNLAYRVLLVLLLPVTIEVLLLIGINMLFALGKHRCLALLHALEAGANLLLSLLLVQSLGLIGVALGTALPMLMTKLFFLPRYISRAAGVPFLTLLGRGIGLPVALASFLGGLEWLIWSAFPLGTAPYLCVVPLPASLLFGGALFFWYLTPAERSLLREIVAQAKSSAQP